MKGNRSSAEQIALSWRRRLISLWINKYIYFRFFFTINKQEATAPCFPVQCLYALFHIWRDKFYQSFFIHNAGVLVYHLVVFVHQDGVRHVLGIAELDIILVLLRSGISHIHPHNSHLTFKISLKLALIRIIRLEISPISS